MDHAIESVLVIGGGLAGIATAMALSRNGLQVTLIESKRRLGGRTGSFTTSSPSGEERVDYCQHVGMGCCTNLKQLIKWLNQEESWQEYDALNFYGSDGQFQRLAAIKGLPAPLHLSKWLLRWPNLSSWDRLTIAFGMFKIRGIRDLDRLDDQSAIEWLRGCRQTKNGIERFWNTIIVSALGEEIENVSLAAVCKVLQDGFLNHTKAFHLLVPQKSLDELFNTDAERCLRKAGVDVRLGLPAQHIDVTRKHSTEVTTRDGVFSADAIVVTVPWHQLGKLQIASTDSTLGELTQRAETLKSSPITGVHTWWDRPWFAHPHAAIVGRLCQWIFNDPAQADELIESAEHLKTEHQTAPKKNHYYQIVISASRSLPSGNSSEVRKLIQDDLAETFPESANAKLIDFKVVTDPKAVFSVGPGSSAHRPVPSRVAGNLWLAGDWTKTGWPATMEGAILSGFLVSESILASTGQRVKIQAEPLR